MLKIPKKNNNKPYIAQKHAVKQEQRLANRLGAEQVRGSGCGVVRGDVRKKGILRLENKCSAKKSFRVTIEMLEKIENAGLQSGEWPAIQIEFIDEKGRVLHRCAVLPDYVIDELVELLDRESND